MPRDANRLYAEVNVTTAHGQVYVGVAGSRARSLAASHRNAIKRFRETGDVSVLAPFRGKHVGGVELLTDPDAIERLGNLGLGGDDQFYRLR